MTRRPRPDGNRFEVHEHTFVSGPRANGGHSADGTWLKSTFSHSHFGGSRAHAHPGTGPASFTIDKDDWFRNTGLVGGGRKRYTAKPTGEQFPIAELEDWQKSFEVVIHGEHKPELGNGPGIALPERIALRFDMTYTVRDERPGRRRR